MNFTSELKREFLSRFSLVKTREEKLSALSAFFHTCAVFGETENGASFFLVSETENVAEFFTGLFSSVFDGELVVSGASRDKKSGRGKLVLVYRGENAEKVLSELGIYKKGKFVYSVDKRFFDDEKLRVAFIKGAFLGGGSCTVPTEKGRSYHLEVDFSEKKTADSFVRLLDESAVFAKSTERNGKYLAYLKSKECISDFLAVTGAENSLKKFELVIKKRDESNRNNRAANCFSGNADKTAKASVSQILVIRALEENGRTELLDSALKELCKARTENPTLSLQELADKLNVTKSCLNHRMRKLTAIYNELKQTENTRKTEEK